MFERKYVNKPVVDRLIELNTDILCTQVIVENTFEFWGTLKNNLREKDDLFRNIATLDSDKIKLDQPGWENRYYQVKFLAENMEDIIDIRRDVVSFIIYFWFNSIICILIGRLV